MMAAKLLHACIPVLLLAGACTIQSGGEQGLLQPQSTEGACVVKKFFLVRLSSTPTEMSMAANALACRLTLINPDAQIVNDAALVTAPPAHGAATATLIQQGRSVAVSYTPAPGFTGADRFEVTIQPQARAVMFAVNVQPSVK